MQIKTLSNISIEVIADTFNLAFSDYFVPVHLTPQQLADKMKSDKVNPEYSVGAFENEKLIALILHGTDIINTKKVVYNGGTGVIPPKRGQALTKRMYDFILPVLKEQGVDYAILEAISQNIQAIKSYQKVGFKIDREVNCYKGQIEPTDRTGDIKITELKNYDWPLMQSFWDFTPTWQNASNTVDAQKGNNISLGAYINSKLAGYVIFNPNTKRIQQLAVDKNHRRTSIASILLDNIIEGYGKDLSVINVDNRSIPANSFLLKAGFENYVSQVEMKLEL